MKEFPTKKNDTVTPAPEKEQLASESEKQELSPSQEKQREEIAAVFEEILRGKEYETLKEVFDDKGLAVWEISVKTDGGADEYSYARKGEPIEGQICDTKIDVYFLDEDGMPMGGDTAAILEVGGWKLLDSSKPEGDLPEEAWSPEEKMEKEERLECESYVEEIEGLFPTLLHEKFLEDLNSITTEQEAEASELRETFKEALSSVLKKLHFLRDETNISSDKYELLHAKYKTASRAVGVISGKKGHGIVDHER